MMNFVIGIDASTTKTGVSVFKLNKSGKKLVHYYLIDAENNAPISSELKTKKKDNKATRKKKSNLRTMARVEYTIREMLFILRKFQKSTTRIAIEDTYGTTDPSSVKSLARIQGSVYGFCLENNIELKFVAPSTWRSKVGIPLEINGKRLKRDDFKRLSVAMVKEKYEIEVGDDLADAILIGEVA